MPTATRLRAGDWNGSTRAMKNLYAMAVLLAAWLPLQAVQAASPGESYRPVPMPPGVRVEATELDGPVFADAKGKTLYQWPLQLLRNGPAGDPVGISTCTDTRTEVSAGLMSPYPGGLRLAGARSTPKLHPDVAAISRRCTRASRLANGPSSNARTVRYSGRTSGLPLYTSYLDQYPGDVLGGRSDKRHGDSPAMRVPVGPPSGRASRLRR